MISKTIFLHEQLRNLLGKKEPVVISLIKKLERDDPALRKKNKTIIENELKSALEKARQLIDDNNVLQNLKTQVDQFLASFDLKHIPPGLAVYITPEKYLVFHLPFEPREKVIVDTTYEVRDLLLTINRYQPFWVLLISRKETPLYTGVGEELTPVNDKTLYQTLIDIDYETFTKGDRAPDPTVLVERKFFNALAQRLRYIIHTYLIPAGNLPVMILCNDKEKNYVNRIVENEPFPKENYKILAGDYFDPLSEDLRKRYRELVLEWIREEHKRQLARKEEFYKLGRVSAGVEETWKAALLSAVQTLLVKEGFRKEAWTHKDDPFQIVFEKPADSENWDYHADIVDDLIEEVVKNKGQVFFIAPDQMDVDVYGLLRFKLPL